LVNGQGCYVMINLSRRRSPCRQKNMCLAATGWLQGRAAKLLLARRKSWYSANLAAICLAANGSLSKNQWLRWKSYLIQSGL